MKDKNKKEQGRLNKQRGAAFEIKVRNDLQSKGWNVSKFQSNVEFKVEQEYSEKDNLRIIHEGKLVPAKRKYNPFSKTMMVSSGFPDFICWKIPQIIVTLTKQTSQMPELKKALSRFQNFNVHTLIVPNWCEITAVPEIIGVEAKSNGYLDKEEKAKCKWLLENKVFSKILIAKKKKEGRKVVPEYIDFRERYMQ